MSKRNNHSYVSNDPKAIAGIFAQKRRRVQPDAPVMENTIQPRPAVQTMLNSTMRESMDAHTQSHATDLRAQFDTSAEIQGSTQPVIKNVRGSTKGLNADKVQEFLGTKIPVTLTEKNGRPTGPYAEMFANEIGIILRNHLTMDVAKWKLLSPEVKMNLLKRLTTKYDIDMSLHWVKRYVNTTFGKCFTNFRSTLNIHFKRSKTMEEALKKKHKNIRTNAEWAFLCSNFASDEFKTLSKTNAANREKLLYHHKAGSKSFLSHQEQLASQTGVMLDAIDRFEAEYKSNTKGWDLGAKQKWDEMMSMRTETTQEDGTRTMTDEEICKRVLGTKSGYIKGCGFGPRPLPKNTCHASMYEKNKDLENKLQQTQQTIDAQNVVINALEERAKKFEEFMEKFNNQQFDS